ncbi:DUF4105 domain-containing protein [Stenotrophomonas sp. YIM B06876]|uniref:Lnb N-terminal periplasmic domain-containing protein n=1 Tax=Stenotrophomonas sp. YIM B06876 TaxID=3060211 RepID=UPI00273A4876|nr:DUF4105 domain-containing protein [Stenotrophomonas sp. YIM B06876]
MRTSARVAWVLACALVALWGGFALWFQIPAGVALRSGMIGIWVLAGVLAMRAGWTPSRHWRSVLLFAGMFGLMLGWWSTITPSQDRAWADDVAQPLRAAVHGQRLVVENVRDFTWRTESDYDIRWQRREYDLAQLQSADLILSYWMGPAIAHTLVSFGFADGRQLVFSLEIRKQRGESFSALGGFFRKFETVLVAADERDIVRVRSNVRGEDVYLYRIHGLSQPDLQELLRAYVSEGDALLRAPRFYNTLTSNCTTVAFELMRRIAPGLPLDYRLLLSGYLDRYAFDMGGLTPGTDFQRLRERGRITGRALQAGDSADFSRRIRQDIPGIPKGSTQ